MALWFNFVEIMNENFMMWKQFDGEKSIRFFWFLRKISYQNRKIMENHRGKEESSEKNSQFNGAMMAF